MPIIHKSEIVIEEASSKLNWPQSLMKLRLEKIEKFPNSFPDRIHYCICIHPKSSHKNEQGICCYNGEYCICSGFSSLNFKIKIEITNADIFEFEVLDHSERDSFSWWNEFNLWEINNE